MDKSDFYWTAACLLLLAVANKLCLDVQKRANQRIGDLEADVSILKDWARITDENTADM